VLAKKKSSILSGFFPNYLDNGEFFRLTFFLLPQLHSRHPCLTCDLIMIRVHTSLNSSCLVTIDAESDSKTCWITSIVSHM